MNLNLLQFFMKTIFLSLILCSIITRSYTLNCETPTSEIQSEICNIEQLIKLYSQKLQILKKLQYSDSQNQQSLSSPLSKQLNIIPKHSNFSSFETYFIPPSYTLSQTILYDLSKKAIEKVFGKVLMISPYEITTLIQKQVNIVSVKQKVSQQLWGFQKQNLPSLWVYIKSERTLVQYYQNIIYLTNKHGRKDIQWEKQILKILRWQTYLLVICKNDFGRINLVDFEKNNFVLPSQIQIIDCTFDFARNNNIYFLATDQKIHVLDFKKNNFIAQISIKTLQKPRLYMSKNFLFVTSPETSQLFIINITLHNQISQITPLKLCYSDDPQTIYDYKIHPYMNSIFIVCSRKSQRQEFSKIFEILLPEVIMEELLPRWIQYVIIPVVILFFILYKKWNNKDSSKETIKKLNKSPTKTTKSINDRNKLQKQRELRQMEKLSRLQKMIREQSQKISHKNPQQNMQNIDNKLLFQKKKQ